MTDLIPTGGNAFTNTARTTGCDAPLPSLTAGPDAAIRAKLDSMIEGSASLESCAGCEGDCYCQTCPAAVEALAAVLDQLIVVSPGAHLVDYQRGEFDLSNRLRRDIATALGIEQSMPDASTKIELGPSWFCGDGDVPARKREIFHGTVQRVYADGESFSARLVGDTHGADPKRLPAPYFGMDFLSGADRPLVRRGATFWLIVETVLASGRPRGHSALCFRRDGDPPPGEPGGWAEMARAELLRGPEAQAESTKIGCKCTDNSDDDVTPEEFDAMLDAGQPVEPAWAPRPHLLLPEGVWLCVCNYMNGAPICTHCGRSKARSEPAQQRAAVQPAGPLPVSATACSYTLTSLPAGPRVTIRGTGTITVDLACPGRETSRQHIRLIDECEVRRGGRQDGKESP